MNQIMRDCDILWAKAVKLRSGNRCEITGNFGTIFLLESHHVMGKSTLALRYSLKNGICLIYSLHRFKVHSTDPKIFNKYKDIIKSKIILREGEGIIEELNIMKNQSHVNLKKIKQELQKEIKRLERGN